MIAVDHNGNQRWRERRQSFRPAGEAFVPSEFEVAEISERAARAFVELHHYSASYPAARFRFGLARRGELVGVAVYSHPCNDAVITNAFPMLQPTEGTELGRLVLLDEVPGNAESFFVARNHELLRGRVAGVVSHSDPMARTCADGSVVMPGHVGTIYQAHNGRYLGRGRGELLTMTRCGRVISRRSLSKLRNGERGASRVYEQLRAAGAPEIRQLEDPAAYVQRAIAEGPFRQVRHPGNHVYAWPLGDRRARRQLLEHFAPAQAYPKHVDQVAA